jgi:hypothetical protein
MGAFDHSHASDRKQSAETAADLCIAFDTAISTRDERQLTDLMRALAQQTSAATASSDPKKIAAVRNVVTALYSSLQRRDEPYALMVRIGLAAFERMLDIAEPAPAAEPSVRRRTAGSP